MAKTYEELIKLKTFEERLDYLKLKGVVAEETFGSLRYVNQEFYRRDPEWLKARQQVIIRDCGCDLGIDGLDIHGGAIVHHINPVTPEQIRNRDPCLFDLNNLITVRAPTHNVIHYGNAQLAKMENVERRPNDTCPWKK